MPEIGDLLGGRYRLLEPLGEGGMATIYRAHDVQLGRDVAAKLLRPEYGRDSGFVARFRQEAQSAASLNHPNVVNVFDYGTDRAGPFIVMELVEGGDLASLIREEAPLPPTAAAEIARQIADALSAAHARRIVHRDIKPSNVLLAPGGRVKVVDFGIARAFSEAQLTLPGTTLGSVHYFSPEQARGEPVTPSSDLYSLGLVLYEMLTGQRAWRGESPAAVAMARLAGEPPVPSRVQPGVPAGLDAIVRRALATDPDDRFPSAGAFSQALQRFLEAPNAPMRGLAPAAAGVPTSAHTVVTPVPPQPRPHATPMAAAAPMPARGTYTGRRALDEEDEPRGGVGAWGWAAAILALLLLVAGAVLIFLALNRGGGVAAPTATPAPTPAVAAVPRLIGLTFQQAETVADAAGFRITQEATEITDDFPENTITSQDPAEGSALTVGETIKVTLATRSPTVAVPDVREMPERDAIEELEGAELRAGERSLAYDGQIPRGRVIRTDPRAGIQVARGTTVDYVVSRGPRPTPRPTPTPTPTPTPPPVTVGNYCGMTLEDAREQILRDGLVVGVVTGTAQPDDYVLDQRPLPGERVPRGSAVTLHTGGFEPPEGFCLSATPSPGP